jgi:hypothetical protein
MHISFGGFVAFSNGEMNWIKVDEEIFNHVGRRISGVFIVPRWRGKYFDINVITN